MKKSTLIIALVATLASSAWATEPEKKNSLVQTQKTEILSPELEELFKSDRLSEAIVQPTYTAAEQIIFTKQVKQLKQLTNVKKKKIH